MEHEMRKYIDTFKERLTESENFNISDVSDSTVNFIIWMTNKTTSIQSNVRPYKGKMYFTDRRIESGRNEGGIEDLWKVYVKEMIG